MRFSRITGSSQVVTKQSFKISHSDPSSRLLIKGLDTVIIEIGIHIIEEYLPTTEIDLGILFPQYLNKPSKKGIYIVNPAIEFIGDIYINTTESTIGNGLIYISYI